MGYVERRLTTGEAVLYQARLHWVIFVAPALLALAGAGALTIARQTDDTGLARALELAGFGVLAIATILVVARMTKRATTEFAVTNKRVLIKVGVLSRRSVELMLGKIEAIAVDQDLWGRLLGYGTVQVTGSGGTRGKFEKIARPLRLRTEIESRVPA